MYVSSIDDHNTMNIITITSSKKYLEVHYDNCTIPRKKVIFYNSSIQKLGFTLESLFVREQKFF